MKKSIYFLLMITLMITMVVSTTVNAEQNGEKLVVESNQNTITVSLNGKNIEFDVAPQIINDRTMVPLRAIFEALGASSHTG